MHIDIVVSSIVVIILYKSDNHLRFRKIVDIQ